MQGAGGVGGLLSVADSVTGDLWYSSFDANGNVSEYLDDMGAVVAHYEYSPFGRVIATSGSPDDFAFRFSTKYQDDETDLLYYGFRYYNPETGRWMSWDPIEERGGLNLYAFVGNDGVNKWDLLGMVKDGDSCASDLLWTVDTSDIKFSLTVSLWAGSYTAQDPDSYIKNFIIDSAKDDAKKIAESKSRLYKYYRGAVKVIDKWSTAFKIAVGSLSSHGASFQNAEMTVNFLCCVCNEDGVSTWRKLSVSRSDDADNFPLRLTNSSDRSQIVNVIIGVMSSTAGAVVKKCKGLDNNHDAPLRFAKL